MRGLRKPAASAALLLGSLLVIAGRADALDLNGAWASDASQCAKVFVRQRGRLGFTEMSDVYGAASSSTGTRSSASSRDAGSKPGRMTA